MGKSRRYAPRPPIREGGVAGGYRKHPTENGEGKDPDEPGGSSYKREDELSKEERMMLQGLVQWRYNMLAGIAVIDRAMAAQREAWKKLLEKLERSSHE